MAGIKRTAADKWFSDCIRLRDNWACRHCSRSYPHGKAQGLDCAHIFGRASKSVRWCADNAISLCMGCHRHFTENPIEFTRWLGDEIGEGQIQLIEEKKWQPLKTNAALRSEIAKHYREEYRRMERDNTRDLVSWN